MKFFKVILNTVGRDNEKVFFIIPPAEEADENGNPAYDEDFLLSNTEYKTYLKETKAAVVSVTYILYEADDSTRLNYDELLKNEDKFFKLDQNDYLIEVKKAKPKSGGKKSSTTMLYVILGIAAAAVVAMLIYDGSLKKVGHEPSESESDISDLVVNTDSTISETAEITSSIENETSEESSTVPTAAAETSSETETTTPISSTTFEPPVTTTATAELTYTLIFDTNGGLGSLESENYAENAVVELPYMGISKIGNVLMGWADAPTEPYTIYNNGTSRYVMPSAPVTLYAIWTAAEYEVTYNYQIGANAVSSKERGKYGELIQLMDVSDVVSDAGEFVGWGLLPNADEPVQSLTMPDGGIELYAIYKALEN